MKQRLLVRYLVLTFFIVALAVISSAQQKKRLTFDQINRGGDPQLFVPLPSINSWEDDSHYLEMRRKEGDLKAKWYSVDAKSGKEKEVPAKTPDLSEFKDLVGADINVNFPTAANQDRTRLIYMKENDLYFLNTEKKEFKRLTESKAEEKNPTL